MNKKNKRNLLMSSFLRILLIMIFPVVICVASYAQECPDRSKIKDMIKSWNLKDFIKHDYKTKMKIGEIEILSVKSKSKYCAVKAKVEILYKQSSTGEWFSPFKNPLPLPFMIFKNDSGDWMIRLEDGM